MTMTDLTATRQRKIATIGVLMAIVLIGGGGVFSFWWLHRPAAFGIDKRVAWTNSKVVGTPEPPDPFMMERVFPKLKFREPLEIAFEPGGERVVVVQHDGKILSFRNNAAADQPDLMINISQLATLAKIKGIDGDETIGFTFDPDFQKNHYCYVCYHANFPGKPALEYAKAYPQNATATHVSRFTVSDQTPPTIDPQSEQIIIAWPGNGHNAGCLKFGPDGDLYISTGDNGDPNPPDPFQIAQNVGDLRSKILRIDVHHPEGDRPYSIPTDNPFVSLPDARGEVFAYGMRNPWRFSFDRESGDIFAGDVGWELWESVDHVTKGGNYGWSINEGPQPVYPHGKVGPTPISPSDISLPHTEAASITGGYVYHGKRVPELQGQYLFGDWETRRLWAAPFDGKKLGKYRTIAQTELRIVSFGEDAEGEVYVLDYEGGGIYRVAPNPNVGTDRNFPRKLSQTGLFANLTDQVPNAGVFAFNINSPQWVDGSSSVRFIAVPNEEAITADKDDANKLIFPKDTVLVRTLSLPMAVGDETTRKKIETQLLHFDGRQWHGYSYRWDMNQTDATLVDGDGLDMPITVADASAANGKRQQMWHFNSRAQCMTCHTSWTHYALAYNQPQLDRTEQYQVGQSIVADSQLHSFRHLRLLPEAQQNDGSKGQPAALVNPYEEDANRSLDERARSYLAVNCSVCHRFGGGGTALIDLSREKTLGDMKLFMPPMLGTFNLPEAQVVCAGNSARSVMLYRMAKSGIGRMPRLGSTVIDEKGLSLIQKWIESLKGDVPAVNADVAKEEAEQETALKALERPANPDSTVIAVDKLIASTEGALKLLTAIENGRVQRGNIAFITSRATLPTSPEPVRDLFTRFNANAALRLGMNPDVEKLLAMPGDAERGKKVFFEVGGGLCSKCHVVGEKGTEFGPNLTQIGGKYNRADMLDNIIHPSKTIAQGFETYVVRTKTRESYIGLLASKTDAAVVLKDQERKLITIKTEDIDKMAMQPISAMPDGIIAELEPQQAADLLEYLATRK